MAADEVKNQTTLTVEVERDTLLKSVTALERENRIFAGRIDSVNAEKLEDLRAKNKELKANLLAVEKALALELMDRKTPIDAVACADRMQVLKIEVLGYCVDRKIEHPLWKKLESL